MKRIVFSDVDKTLRTPGEPMSERVKELIRQIIALGIRFVYCTGKPCAYIAGAATEWNTPGAWILGSTGTVLYKGTTMPPCDGYKIYPFPQDEVEQFQSFIKEMHKRLEKIEEIFWQPNGEAETFVQTPFWGNDNNLKKKIIDVFYELLEKMPHDKIKYFDNVDALDIIIASVDKASGMKWVAQMEGVSLEDCYALGDSDNDMPMLKEVKKYKHDYVVGSYQFEGYNPTYRFDTYEKMLEALLNDLQNDMML